MPYLKKILLNFILTLSFCLISFNTSIAQSIKTADISLHNKLLYIKGNNIWASDTNGKQYHQLTSTGDISNFTIASDLSKMVLVRNFKKLFIIDISTGNEKYIANVHTDMSAPSISPCNTKILITSKSKNKLQTSEYSYETVRHIFLFDLNRKKQIDLMEKSVKPSSAPHWSPDGKQISFTSSSSEKKDWYIYTMQASSIMDNKKKEIMKGFNAQWLDNETLMIGTVSGPEEGITVYNMKDSKIVKEIKFNTSPWPLKFSHEPPNSIYYEDGRENPDLDIGHLDISNLKQNIIIRDARSPIYCK